MLFQPLERLEELLVRLLAHKPGLSAAAVAAALRRSGHAYSTAALYKELAKLQEHGIVLRSKGRYSLSLNWMLQILALGRMIEQNYLGNTASTLTLPQPGQRLSWRFDSLLRVNDFSSHVVLLLVAQAQEKIVYSWNPHAYFYLAQTQQETGYVRSLRIARGMFYKVIGGEAPLDRWTERFWRGTPMVYAFRGRGFEDNRRLYYNVVESYIVSFLLEPRAAEMIDGLYARTRQVEDLDLPGVLELFHGRYRSTFVIEHNEKKAARIRAKFSRFLGLKPGQAA